MLDKLKKATPGELQLWMISASATGFALGAIMSNLVSEFAVWILGIGFIIHLWSMYRIYAKEGR